MLRISEKVKKMGKNLISILVLLMMLLSNSSMVIASEILENAQNESPKEIAEAELIKYSNYKVQDKKGSLIKFKLTTGVEYPEDAQTYNLKKSVILLNMPLLKNKFPESVTVVSDNAQTKKDENQFTYVYDKETGALQINIGNQNIGENSKEIKNECQIICNYDEATYEEEDTKKEATIQIVAQSYIDNEEENVYTAKNDINFNLREKNETVISASLGIEPIYDGYIKCNKVNGTDYETTYKEETDIDIGCKVETLWLNVVQENQYLNSNNEVIDGLDGINYKSTKVNKQNVLDIVGDDGALVISTDTGDILKRVNKDTEENDVEIQYDENTKKVSFMLLSVKKPGTLKIENIKSLPANIGANVSRIKTKQSESVFDYGTDNPNSGMQVPNAHYDEIGAQEVIQEIQKSTSNVEVEINNNNMTNGATNDVTITATLQSDSPQYELYRNPKIQIELPEDVEKVVLGDVSLVHTDELSVKNAQILEGSNGKKSVIIELSGTQTKYIGDSINKGINVIIPVKLILKNDIESKKSSIKIAYANEVLSGNKYISEQKNANDIEVNIVAVTKEPDSSGKTDEKTDEKADGELNEDKNNNSSTSKDIDSNNIELSAYAQIGSKKLSNGDSIHETEIIKYVVEVKNTSNKKMTNVKINSQIPEGTVYATINRGSYYWEDYTYEQDTSKKDYSFEAETLEPGETKRGFYEVVINKLDDNITEKNISNKISIVSGGKEIKSVILENKIIKAKLKVYLRSYIGRDAKNSFYYYLDITNTSNEDIKTIELTSNKLQKELDIWSSNYYEDSESTGTGEFGKFEDNVESGTMSGIKAGATRTILMKSKAKNFDENVNELPITMSFEANIKDSNETYYSNENRRTAYPEYVTAQITSDKEGEEIKPGDIVTYKLIINNPSKIRTYVNVTDFLPTDYLQGIKLTYKKYLIEDDIAEETRYDIEEEANMKYTLENFEKDISEKYTDVASVDESIVILAGKSVEMTITAKAKDVLKTTEVSNYATVAGSNIKKVTSNISKFTIISNYEEKNDDKDSDNINDNNQSQNKNTISGVVWKDENKDGKRDSEEQLLSGVKVKLYNVNTKILSKKNDGTAQEIQTDTNGNYKFTNVENGEYWVLFEYDTNQYGITTYKKSGVSENLNSDVIEKQVSINGVEKKVGLTDTLKISDSGYSNIDMGLISNGTFDLKLDKYISKVNLNIPNGSKEYTYDNTQFAKIEIKSKQIKNAIITIEYKIKITNEGDIEGYASEITDYIPSGYTMDTTQNSEWIKNDNGTITNKSLSSEFIKPGESKELTLTLKKQLNEDDTGSVKNSAEITSCRNSYGIPDKDSIPGNKASGEDDYSEAELLISIETGFVMYTVTILILAIVLMILIYIMKNGIKTKTIKILGTFLLVFCTINMQFISEARELDIRIVYEPIVDANNKITGWQLYHPDPNRKTFYEADIDWRDKETHKHSIKKQNSSTYYCVDAGQHQCTYGAHKYNNDVSGDGNKNGYIFKGENPKGLDIKPKKLREENYTLKENIKIEQNSDSVKVKYLNENYYLVGPYYINTNTTECTIKSLEMSYVKGGRSYISNDLSDIVDENGNTIGLDLKKDTDYKFYIKVSNGTEKINKINLNIQILNVKKHVDVYQYFRIYYVKSVGKGYVHTNSQGGFVEKKVEDTQKMGEYYEEIKSTPYHEEREVSFGEVLLQGKFELQKNDETTGKPLSNIGFTLKMTDGTKAGQYVGIDENGNATYSENAVTLRTDENGQIKINFMEKGNYELIETFNPYEGYGDLPKVINSNLNIKAGSTTKVNVTNKRQYINLSGYVWEDIAWTAGKETFINELYHGESGDTQDKKLANIIVKLKDSNGNEIARTATDSNGSYKFNKVDIDKLSDYHIEFEYNGMSYENVSKIETNLSNGSKAAEGAERTTFNNKFTTIGKGKAYAGGDDTSSVELKYNEGNNKSTIILGDNPQYGYNGGNKPPVNGVYDQYLINSSTQNAYGGNLDKIKSAEQIRQDGTTEITDINLGLKEREQPDVAVNKDLYSARVQVGNYNHVYNYADRYKNIAGDNITDPTVKFGMKYGNKSYTRGLYASDIVAAKNGDTSLSVNVIYEISLKNESTNLTSVINRLNEYYDSKYEFVKIGNDVENGYVVDNAIANGLGDVNGDGKINYLDAISILRYVERITEFTADQIARADVNSDGKVTNEDAQEILKYDAEIIDKFEAQNKKQNLLIGDVNEDGEVSILDAVMVLRYANGLTDLTSDQKIKADFNYDGKITEDDAKAILEYDAGKGERATAEENGYTYTSVYTGITIPPQSERKIYIELKVKPEEIYKLLDKTNNSDRNPTEVKLDNIVEIASYGTKDKDNTTYAGIDVDSQPGNTDVTKQVTWEDDTDKAPGLLLKLQEERKANGIVFEDNTEEQSDGTRKGDGLYNSTDGKDTVVPNVKVRLADEEGNTVQTYEYNKDTGKYDKKNAETTTDNQGQYTIIGFLPGNYHLEYEWGGENHNVYDYKSTTVDKNRWENVTNENNLEWYKNNPDIRYSDAVDNYQRREEIDKQYETVTNGTKSDYNNSKSSEKMTATTPNFVVNLEYNTGSTNNRDEYKLNDDGSIKIDENGYAVKKDGYKNELINIDFGIAKRAKQELELTKYVKEVKLSLANGNILLDSRRNNADSKFENTKYIASIPKSNGANEQIKVEIDSEIIQGASLELTYGFKVENTSEVDYNDQAFYLYGEKPSDISKVITLKPTKIIDYTDGKLVMNDDNSWEIVNVNGLINTNDKKQNYINDDVKAYATNITKILVYKSDKALYPTKLGQNENSFEINITGSKLLANTSDETLMENNAEIIETVKTGGSMITTTPGNYVPTDSATFEKDSSSAENVVILPPTGLATYTIEWIVLILSSLGILMAGIILIKKYVLK